MEEQEFDAGGVVIAPTVITDFAPLYCEEGGTNVVTQLDKDDVEAVGLVKFDFLGLRTLTVIEQAVRFIRQSHDPSFDIHAIPLDDQQTFALLQAANTAGAKCIAVTNSTIAENLSHADLICDSLENVDLKTIKELIS